MDHLTKTFDGITLTQIKCLYVYNTQRTYRKSDVRITQIYFYFTAIDFVVGKNKCAQF